MTKTKTGVDQRLVRAIGHPLRLRLLTIFNERVASPSDLAAELGEPIGNVSYHTRILARLGCVELVKTKQVRGAVEHYYRAVVRPVFSDDDWAELPLSIRKSLAGSGADRGRRRHGRVRQRRRLRPRRGAPQPHVVRSTNRAGRTSTRPSRRPPNGRSRSRPRVPRGCRPTARRVGARCPRADAVRAERPGQERGPAEPRAGRQEEEALARADAGPVMSRRALEAAHGRDRGRRLRRRRRGRDAARAGYAT